MASSIRKVQPNHFGLSTHQRALVRNVAMNIETNIKHLLLQFMTPEYSREFLYQMGNVVNLYALSKLPMIQAVEYVRIANRFEDFLVAWTGSDDSVDLLSEDFQFCLSTLRRLKDLYTGSAYPTTRSESDDNPADLDYLRELVDRVQLDDDQRYVVGIELQRLQEMRPNEEILVNYHGA